MARQEALLRLHKTLLGRRTELRKRLGKELEDLAHVKHSSASGDAADAAFDASGEELASTLAELESKELAQIERALRRLKSGSYGKCEACSCTIPVARLNALPYSTLCIKCQREMESEGGWLHGKSAEDWGRISDGGNPMEDRDVTIADLEIDMSK
jgi:DnaK suppressor protein